MLTVREYQKISRDDCPHFDELIKFAAASDFLDLNWRYVQAKNFSGKTFRNAQLDTSRLPLYEIFIRQYLDMVAELVKRELKSSYVGREENLRVVKGKLLRTTRDQENFRLTTRLLADFDSVDASTNFAKDFAAVSIDRTNRAYEVVMQWTKIFLSGKSFTSFAGKSQVQALLFPMETLFESFVTHYVRKNFADSFTVTAQAGGKFLFDVSKACKLRPDILLTGDDPL